METAFKEDIGNDGKNGSQKFTEYFQYTWDRIYIDRL